MFGDPINSSRPVGLYPRSRLLLVCPQSCQGTNPLSCRLQTFDHALIHRQSASGPLVPKRCTNDVPTFCFSRLAANTDQEVPRLRYNDICLRHACVQAFVLDDFGHAYVPNPNHLLPFWAVAKVRHLLHQRWGILRQSHGVGVLHTRWAGGCAVSGLALRVNSREFAGDGSLTCG